MLHYVELLHLCTTRSEFHYKYGIASYSNRRSCNTVGHNSFSTFQIFHRRALGPVVARHCVFQPIDGLCCTAATTSASII